MRSVSRKLVLAPGVVGENGAGAKEKEKAIAYFAELLSSVATDPKRKKRKEFVFKVYKHPSIRGVLESLFHGKCAYCEGRYAGLQPVDIEHWRPKKEVIIGDQPASRRFGYYWLASDWENLFPSCIDCNRVREHLDFATNQKKTMGKGNWFPVADERKRSESHSAPMKEEPLLLNPCSDEPSDFLMFHIEGFVSSKSDLSGTAFARAEASIRFYALNRIELVRERRARILLIRHRMTTIGKLAILLQKRSLSADVKEALEDLLSHELNYLKAFQDPQQPFSAMAKQLIDEFIDQFRV